MGGSTLKFYYCAIESGIYTSFGAYVVNVAKGPPKYRAGPG